MATINASTSGVGGVITTADATGVLDLQTADVTRASVSSSGLKISRVDSSSEGGQLDLCRSTDNTSAWAIDVYGNTSTPSLRFVDNVAASARMAIDGSGNVGIGTASPTSRLQVTGNQPQVTITGNSSSAAQLNLFNNAQTSGQLLIGQGFDTGSDNVAYISNQANAPMIFRTNSAERMRIDSSGNVLVGTTSSSDNTNGAKLELSFSDATRLKIMKTASGATNGILFYQAGTYQGGLNFGNGSTSLATSSDQRLKENIYDAPSVLDKINAVKVRSFDWKDSKETVVYGFIAQEIEKVFPEAVAVGKDTPEGDIEMPWSVTATNLIPHLIKAIQELKTIIDTQAERIAVLENKIV